MLIKLFTICLMLTFIACQKSQESRHKIKRQGSNEARAEQSTKENPEAGNEQIQKTDDESNPATGTTEEAAAGSDQQAQIDQQQAANNSNSLEDQAQDSIPEMEEELKPTPTPLQILEQPGDLALIQIDQAFIEQKMREFTGNIPVTIDNVEQTLGPRDNQAGKSLALAFLREEYEKIGFEVSTNNYGTGINLIAEKKGNAPESRLLILGSHYDSVATAGADDDASGVIGALAIARALANTSFDYSLRIVAFDEEELGLIGSNRYVNKLIADNETDQVIGSFILEMLGYDGNNDSAFHIVDCKFIGEADQPEGNSGKISQLLLDAVALSSSPLIRSEACTDRSDHTSFWNQGIPAVVLSQDFFGGDSNPCYHNACDTIDMIDFIYMSSITSVAAIAVASLLTAKQN